MENSKHFQTQEWRSKQKKPCGECLPWAWAALVCFKDHLNVIFYISHSEWYFLGKCIIAILFNAVDSTHKHMFFELISFSIIYKTLQYFAFILLHQDWQLIRKACTCIWIDFYVKLLVFSNTSGDGAGMRPEESLTWAVLVCLGVRRLRGRGGLGSLVWAHVAAVLAQTRAVLTGFLISQVQRRALLHGPAPRAHGGVHFQERLSLVLFELSVVCVRDSTFVQALVVLAHPRDLQLVGDVIALDLDCLWRERRINPLLNSLGYICAAPDTLYQC